MSLRLIASWSLLALLAACDKASLPAAAMAAARPVTATETQVTERDPNAELQQRCAQEARAWFEQQNAWQPPDSGALRSTSAYRSHYSGKLGRCYVVVDRSTSSSEARSGEAINLQTSRLTDILSNRDIGTANWFGSNDVFNQCQVNATACLSRQEWVELLRPYMEN